MERVILDFEQYIARIGVNAFYKDEKPYEKTGQFLLTAYLYQFVRGGAGDLRFEVISGLGRIDILLTYKGKRYIIETKVNRHTDIERTLSAGIDQLAGKYLASEGMEEGCLVVFDTKTGVGAMCEPRRRRVGNKTITSFIIGIGRNAS